MQCLYSETDKECNATFQKWMFDKATALGFTSLDVNGKWSIEAIREAETNAEANNKRKREEEAAVGDKFNDKSSDDESNDDEEENDLDE